MCHAMITRTSNNEGEPLLFLTKDGTWSTRPKDAYKVSEEDAKVFARTLRASAHEDTGHYSYDYTTVDD